MRIFILVLWVCLVPSEALTINASTGSYENNDTTSFFYTTSANLKSSNEYSTINTFHNTTVSEGISSTSVQYTTSINRTSDHHTSTTPTPQLYSISMTQTTSSVTSNTPTSQFSSISMTQTTSSVTKNTSEEVFVSEIPHNEKPNGNKDVISTTSIVIIVVLSIMSVLAVCMVMFLLTRRKEASSKRFSLRLSERSQDLHETRKMQELEDRESYISKNTSKRGVKKKTPVQSPDSVTANPIREGDEIGEDVDNCHIEKGQDESDSDKQEKDKPNDAKGDQDKPEMSKLKQGTLNASMDVLIEEDTSADKAGNKLQNEAKMTENPVSAVDNKMNKYDEKKTSGS